MQDKRAFSIKGFYTVYFGADKRNAVTLPHSAQRKHAFTVKIKNMSKKNKFPARKKIALELLHQKLGHRSTRSLLAVDTANVWLICDLISDVAFLKQFYFLLEIYFSLTYPKFSCKECFLCALYGNVTAFILSAPKYTVQNPL